MKEVKLLKVIVPLLLGIVALGAIFILPVRASDPLDDASVGIAATLPGSDISISGLGGAAPDIEINSEGTMAAAVYFKPGSGGAGSVFIKSTSALEGWLTARLLDTGSSPRLAFSAASTDTVYAVWVSSNGQTIRYAECTLDTITRPSCTSGNVASGSDDLATPDVVVGLNGGQDVIHVAWANLSQGRIETSLLVTSDTSPAWSSPAQIKPSGGSSDTPVLAWSNFAHLAFLLKDSNSQKHETVHYYRSSSISGTHSWANPGDLTPFDDEINSDYDEVGHPTIVATGTNVYLAWDASNTSGANSFGLMRATSMDNGATWNDPLLHITSDSDAGATSESKRSLDSGVPEQEARLRPSLAISNSFAIVWQERPDQNCIAGFQNSSSEINYAYTHTTWLVSDTLLANNADEYSIDPDIAIGLPGGHRHFVFMKGDSTSCNSAGLGEYTVSYRCVGSCANFASQDLDRGEGGLFLPIILKKS